MGNTVIISTCKLVTDLLMPLILALMLNEIRKSWFKRLTQTLVYLPYFISWVLMAGIIIDILSPPAASSTILWYTESAWKTASSKYGKGCDGICDRAHC